METILILLILACIIGDLAARWHWSRQNAPKKRSRAIPKGTEPTKRPGRPKNPPKAQGEPLGLD